MTITASAFPAPLQPASLPASLQTDAEGTPSAGDFAELLATLLAGGHEVDDPCPPLSGQLEEQARRAAELTPLPGTPAEAFSAARLLVDLALDFPTGGGDANPKVGTAAPRMATPTKPSEIAGPPPFSHPDPIFTVTSRTAFHPVQKPGRPVSVTLSLPVPSGFRAAEAFASGSAPAALQPMQLSGIPANNGSPQTPSLLHAAIPVQPTAPPSLVSAPRTASPRIDIAPLRQASPRDPAQTAPSGRTSPYGAQLIAVEGGLKLVLRLPKLAEGERHGVEVALSRLLESHGHRRTAIVIHEIAEG